MNPVGVNFVCRLIALLGGLSLLAGGVASAVGATLSGNVFADNRVEVYLSQSDSLLGDSLGSPITSPNDTELAETELDEEVPYYVHLVVEVPAGTDPSGLVGTLRLNGTGFVFPNGGYTLSSDTSHWKVNRTGFGEPYGEAVDRGVNGKDPWGMVFGVDSDARYIGTGSGSGFVFYSVEITPSDLVSSHTVSISPLDGRTEESGPEPVSLSLAGDLFDASAESGKGHVSSSAKLELIEAVGNETVEGSISFEAGDFIFSGVEPEPGAPFAIVETSLNLSLKGFIRIGSGSPNASVEQSLARIVIDRIRVTIGGETNAVVDGDASIRVDHIIGTGNDRTDLQTSSTPGMEFLLPGPEDAVNGSLVAEYNLQFDETVTTLNQLLPVGEPVSVTFDIDWAAQIRTTEGRALAEFELDLSFPETGAVFNLPKGASVNSASANVVDNRYTRDEADRSSTSGIFLKVGDVEGDSVAEGYEGWIDVSDFYSSVSRTRGFGRRRAAPVWEDLIVSKELDRSSVRLAEAVTKGTFFPEVILVYNESKRGGERISYEYRLKDSSVVSYFVDGDSGVEVEESASFNFERVDWIYTKFGPDGLSEGRIEAWWDLERGTGGSTSSSGDNAPPSVEPVGDISADPGAEGSLELTISDLETAAEDLVVTLSTDRPDLLGDIEITGSGDTRTVNYKTSALRSGFATIVATLSDGVDTRSISIPVLIDVEMTPYEAYLSAYFTDEEKFDPILTGPLSDPDKDGMVTQIEFLLGTNPNEYSPASEAVKVDAGDAESDGKAFSLSYKRRKDDPNVVGQLWGSENGKDWFRLDSSNPLYEETVQGGENPLFDEVTVTYTLPTGGTPAFIRFQSTAAF